MKFLIHETLRTLNTDDVFEFGLTEISKSHEHPDLHEAVTVFIRNRKSQKHKTSGLSEFDVVRSFMTYVGINLRAIAKDDSIEFDLNGLTLDQYIPLTKSLREIMDE
ncbi:hypothetical protein FJW05_15125 [Mesorhizobium sp. B2-9-1]|uniref:hypothetical protein n=1 Tax=Mesorhizobium sp. B2-9-1 TaxID=2589898 RepID=UPI001127B2F4|nr:hypothetical protein [Mesorhizobium sp. B2-9-1]TPI46192.1 hypothetical protein FJW05_15125 [Mesorhizobium sp. B2-9-1]